MVTARPGRPARIDNPHAWPDKAARVRRMFASVAGTYDLLNHLHSANIDVLWRRQAVRLSEVPVGGRVLDLCCGTADLAIAYADHAPQAGRIIGSDFCHEMLVRGRDKVASRRGNGRSIRLIEADGMNLPLADGQFDVIGCAFGLRNIGDPDRALAECFRVLAPGGRLVILEFTLPRSAVLRSLYQFYFRTVMPLAATIISGDRTGAYRYLPDSVANWAGPEALEERLQAAGFVEVDHTLLTFGIAAVHLGCKPLAGAASNAGGRT